MNWKYHLVKFGFGLSMRLEFYDEVKAYLEDGIPLVPTIRELHGMAARRKGDMKQSIFAYIYSDMLLRLEGGAPLSSFMNRWLPADELTILAACESINDYPMGFEKTAQVARSRAELRAELVKNLAYPGFLFVMMIGFMFYFMFGLIPELSKFLDPEKWKGAAGSFYRMITFLKTYGIGVVILIAFATWAAFWSLPRWRGRWRERVDRFPPWNLYKVYSSSSFLIGLSAMLSAGIPFEAALRGVAKNSSYWMQGHMFKALTRMRTGERPEKALDTGLLDPETASKVESYGRLSSFQKAIEALGRRSISKAIAKIKTGSATVSVLMLFMVASMVFWGYYTGISVPQQIAEEMRKK